MLKGLKKPVGSGAKRDSAGKDQARFKEECDRTDRCNSVLGLVGTRERSVRGRCSLCVDPAPASPWRQGPAGPVRRVYLSPYSPSRAGGRQEVADGGSVVWRVGSALFNASSRPVMVHSDTPDKLPGVPQGALAAAAAWYRARAYVCLEHPIGTQPAIGHANGGGSCRGALYTVPGR